MFQPAATGTAAPRPVEWLFWSVLLFGMTTGFTSLTGPNVSERLVWLVADVVAIVAVVRRSDIYAPQLQMHAILISWPALALVSAVWSLDPALSGYHALQLFGTLLVGIVLAVRFGLAGCLRLVFLVTAVGMIASYPMALSGARPGPRGEWIGIYTDKNTFGTMCVIAITTGIALLAVRGWRWLALPVIPLALLLLGGSRSATSVVCLAVVALFPLVAARRGGWPTVALTGTILVAAGTVVTGVVLLSGMELADDLLDALGKDASLTGRTSLWAFGVESFAERPILGLGYKAYWESAATSAGYLRYFVQQHLWFFHNNFLEVAVALGLVGLMAFLAGLVWGAFCVLRAALTAPSPATAWALAGFVHILILCFVENPLFFNHSFAQLLFTILVVGAATAAVSSPAPRSPAGRGRHSGAVIPVREYAP